MARSKSTPQNHTPATVPPQRALAILKAQLDKGEALLGQARLTHDDSNAWYSTTRELMVNCFGSASGNIASFSQAAGGGFLINASDGEREQLRRETMQRRVKLLRGCIEQIEMIHSGDAGPDGDPPDEEEKVMGTIRIFVSHANQDAAVAKALVHMIEGALVVPDGVIRCTSVDGYRLSPGDHGSETLRSDIEGCDVLVGVLTEQSLASGYVIMELGAAWGQRKMTCPLLAPTIKFERIPGPLRERHAIQWDKRADLALLMDAIAKATGFSPRSGDRQQVAVNDFLSAAAQALATAGAA